MSARHDGSRVVRRLLLLAAVAITSAIVAWFTWPRADVEIRVARGGVATVVNAYGRRSALRDTVFIGGSGARRKVRVVNNDTMPHQLAMFRAAAGNTTEYTVPLGTYGGACTAHATSKHLTFVVR